MKIWQLSERLMAMVDGAWQRHANPISEWVIASHGASSQLRNGCFC